MSARRRALRATLAAGTLAAAAAPMILLGVGSSLQADEFCELVTTTGTLLGNHQVGHCFDYQQGTICQTEDIGGNAADVIVEVCIPKPIGLATGQSDLVAGDA